MLSLLILARPMKWNLETKLAIYKNMAENVGQKPVIFTSRAEIWSTDRNPVIVTSHPFPPVSTLFQVSPGDLTREMMEHYRNLAKFNRTGHHPNLILFEFQVQGRTEVHAVFSRLHSTAEETSPWTYFKNHDLTTVSIRQYPFESNPDSVPIVLGVSDLPPAPTNGTAVRSVSVMTTAEYRLGMNMCGDLCRKLKLFQENVRPGIRDAVTFTNVPLLWDLKVPLKVIEDPLACISSDYDHKRFDIEEDILEYVAHVAKRHDCAPFYAYSQRFGDGQFANVHLLFARHDALATSSGPTASLPGSSTMSSSEVSSREITDEFNDGADEIRPIALRLGDDFTRYLETYIPMFVEPQLDAPDIGHCYFLFRTNDEWKADWDELFRVVSLPSWLVPIPAHYDHGKHDVVQDVLDYMSLRYLQIKAPSSRPFLATILRYDTELATEVHIMPSSDDEMTSKHYCYAEEGSLLRFLKASYTAHCETHSSI